MKTKEISQEKIFKFLWPDKEVHKVEYEGMGMYRCSCGWVDDFTDYHNEDMGEFHM